MRPLAPLVIRCLTALTAAWLAAAPAAASITFLGADGASTEGRASVAWTEAGVADSLVQTFGLSPDTVYTDRSFNAAANHALSGFTVWLATSSSLAISASGPADSTAAVAHGALYEYDYGIAGSEPRRAVALLELALRYQSDQPTVYWAILESRPGLNPPPGPAGEVVLTRPPVDRELTRGSTSYTLVGSTGSVPNTGSLDIGALVRTIRTAGQASNWNYSWGFDVFLSEVPLDHFVTAAPESETPSLSLSAPRPNPAPGAVQLAFTLPAATHATLEILDVAGRRVRTLVDGALPAGTTNARWAGDDARGAAAHAGVYFARLIAGRDAKVQRIVLMR